MLSYRQENLLSSEVLTLNNTYCHNTLVKNIVREEFVCDNYNRQRFEYYYQNADIYNRKGELILSLKNYPTFSVIFPKIATNITVSFNGHSITILSEERDIIKNPKVIISDYCPEEYTVIVLAAFEGEMNRSLNLKPSGYMGNIPKNQARINKNTDIAIWFLRDVMRRFAASVDTRFTFC